MSNAETKPEPAWRGYYRTLLADMPPGPARDAFEELIAFRRAHLAPDRALVAEMAATIYGAHPSVTGIGPATDIARRLLAEVDRG